MPMLTGPQIKPFQQALLSAFTRDSLAQMLSTELNKRFEQLVKDTDFDYQVFQLIDRANREGWAYKLLLVAASYNPGNPDLQAYAASLDLAAVGTPPTTSALESLIQKNNSYLDAALFRTRQGWVETAVCRIKIDGAPAGTGFLVGPGAVLTNYHVLPQVISGAVAPAAVTCQFDYKQLPGGQPVSQGIEVGLAGDGEWLIAATPPTAQELAGVSKTALPGPAELDFALLRLEQEIATVALGAETPSVDQIRRRPTARLARLQNRPRLHAQQPALDHAASQGPTPQAGAGHRTPSSSINQNKTRVTYRTNTERGSSGSPVFDQNWNLVALHHMGDPDWSNPTHNEGIPVASIQNYLKTKNLHTNLGQQK